ncbi:MAG: single-stranded DNA-binding protein [Alistipes sp.]|nr:single-stranded DNA-binding protein [Alistipes sp.]
MINKVILVGNVGVDPEVRTLETGVKVARVRLATSERIFNRQTNETTEHTEWHTVTLWRGLADVADKYVRRGSQLYIEGSLRTREWERDGVKHYATEIVADEMKLLGRRPDNAPQQAQQPSYQQPSYQQPAQPSYQQPSYQPQPQPQAPVLPAEDPDDLPF